MRARALPPVRARDYRRFTLELSKNTHNDVIKSVLASIYANTVGYGYISSERWQLGKSVVC